MIFVILFRENEDNEGDLVHKGPHSICSTGHQTPFHLSLADVIPIEEINTKHPVLQECPKSASLGEKGP